MLVLSRKHQETIYIGNAIQVTVLEIRGNRVRLGITAPGHMAVCRAELLSCPATQPESESPPVGPPAAK